MIYVNAFCDLNKICFHITENKFYFFPTEYAEADSFFCFTNLMAEIRDNFIKTLDLDSQCGIGKIQNICLI